MPHCRTLVSYPSNLFLGESGLILLGQFNNHILVAVNFDYGFGADDSAGGAAGAVCPLDYARGRLGGEVSALVGLIRDYDAILWADFHA